MYLKKAIITIVVKNCQSKTYNVKKKHPLLLANKVNASHNVASPVNASHRLVADPDKCRGAVQG